MTADRRYVSLDENEAEAAVSAAIMPWSESAAEHTEQIIEALNDANVTLCRDEPASGEATATPNRSGGWVRVRLVRDHDAGETPHFLTDGCNDWSLTDQEADDFESSFTKDGKPRVPDAPPAPVTSYPSSPGLTVDELGQLIRTVDGNHDLGAGALAEALHPHLRPSYPSNDERRACGVSNGPHSAAYHCTLPAGHEGDHAQPAVIASWSAAPSTPVPAEPGGPDFDYFLTRDATGWVTVEEVRPPVSAPAPETPDTIDCDNVGHWIGCEVGVPGGHDGDDDETPCSFRRLARPAPSPTADPESDPS